MKIYRLYWLFALPALLLLQSTITVAQSLEEFNGPFAGWANIKLRFGAKGNGKDDDTKAIQKAIDGLGPAGGIKGAGPLYTVLYLPAGTYCISTTLVLRGKIGVSIIGEDPSTTIIKWIGPDADTMLWANGSAYYKISRLTWNANNRKEIEAIGIHWKNRWNDGKTQSYASLNIEVSDNTFIGNCKYGISGGTGPEGTNNNDSEIAIKRCTFQSCTGAGIITTGYNALDYWIWDCRFFNCNIGINSRFGNFHAYRSYFKKSLQADVTNTNGYYKSLRGCYSEDSKGFTVDSGASQNPFKRIYQANTVVRSKGMPIQFYHWGRLFFTNNIFDKPVDTSVHGFVKTNNAVISLNNKYNGKTYIEFLSPAAFQQINDSYGASPGNAGATFLQAQEKTPVNANRQVFAVPANADANIIQQLINAAIKLKGKRPIVYFAAGVYKISKPLSIPAGSDIQLVGDGLLDASVILPADNFPGGNAMIKVAGPSIVAIREIQLGNFTNSRKNIDAFQFVNIDQPESRIFVDQLYATANNTIRAEGVDYLYIQKDNSFFADNDFISGGMLVQGGKGTAGLYGFGGQFAGISIQNNAKAVFKDCWWEGPAANPINVSGSGNLTIDGAMIAPAKADSTVSVSIKKFKGNISLINMYLQGSISVSADNPDLKLLLMNMHFYFTLAPLSFINPASSFKGFFTGLTNQCFISGDQRCDQIYKVNETTHLVSNTDAFVTQLIADDQNAMPKKYEIRNALSSSILISRASLGDMNNAIKITK